MMREKSILSSVNRFRGEIMGVAAIWIFCLHEWQYLSVMWSKSYYVERFIKDNGFIGVDMFLLLSGMGLSCAIEKHSLLEFYRRRFKKLIIPVFTAAILRLALTRWKLTYVISCALGYEFLSGNTTAFLWYMYAIAIYYLLFPLYWHFFAKSRKKWLFTALAVLAWYLLFGIALKNAFSQTSWLAINRVPVFLVGTLLGWMERNPSEAPSNKSFIILSALALPLGCVMEYYCSVYAVKILVPMSGVFLPAFMIGVSLVFLLAFFLSGTKIKARAVKFIGGISLEFYCLQEVIGDRVIPILSTMLPPLLVNLSLFALLIVCSVLLHKVSEKVLKIVKL